MTAPTTTQCPFCGRAVRWFYGTATFAHHHDFYGAQQAPLEASA